MRYDRIHAGTFISRPNRFIAHCQLDGRVEVCHVKNTGRCKELLLPGAVAYLQRASNEARSTKYDLIAVEKDGRVVNIDSQAPNKVFREWAEAGGIPDIRAIRPEYTHGHSRFDFYIETSTQRLFVEVKGVTLARGGVALFPDAPTERGVKHLRGLAQCVADGDAAMAVFIIQMDGVHALSPNDQTHPAFGDALRAASRAGVALLALDCAVTPDTIAAHRPIEIRLSI